MNMENIVVDYSHIKGWGIDADPKNDPTYPMKHRTDEAQKGYSWNRPVQQPVNIEVLHSNERSNVTAVFGTSDPPSGLSGRIRRYAFRYGEGSYNHWLPLIFADRVNMIEGIIDDFRQGKVPNLFAEKGGKARWKYNKKAVLLNMLTGIGIFSVASAILFRKKTSLEKG